MGAAAGQSFLTSTARLLFYFDASMLALGMALTIVRDGDVLYPGGPGCPVTTAATPDDEWLRHAGRNGWVVIMRDKRVRRRPRERQALVDHGVTAFCLTGAGNYTSWRILELLVRSWARMEEVVATKPAPFIYSITQEGLRRLA